MKKIGLILVVFLLILSTAIIKNSAKKTEDEIFTVKENVRVLFSEFEKIKLEHDYLSSSEKLLEFQLQFFEDELVPKNIENIKNTDLKINDVIEEFKNNPVYRDQLMIKLSEKFQNYAWERNFGYGTKAHMEGLKKFGITSHHRKGFKPIHKMLSS